MTSPASRKKNAEVTAIDNGDASSGATTGGATTDGIAPDGTSASSVRSAPAALPGRVLIVDDVAANVRLLSGILKVEGFDICTAASGPEALEQVATGHPDVVLLDVMMPGMSGFEVCRHIRADPETATLPVVMVTALQETADRVQALEAGADDFLAKPVDDVEVVARVRSLMRVKRQRDALDQAYRDLKKVESMRDSLTAMLVHDLRTPLTTILGPLEMLQTGQFGQLDDTQREIIAMSTRSGYRLLGLVNELLDVSKMEGGEMTLRRALLDLPPIVDNALEQVARLNQSEAADVQCDLPPDLPPVQADEDLLCRVLINLIGNALKFTSAKGVVRLSAERCEVSPERLMPVPADATTDDATTDGASADGSRAAMIISIRDTGEGIPPEDQERIFEKFGQVESRKAGHKMSSGLGLAFCRLAVEAHGGRIWVESTLGEGSNFRFTLPL